MSDTSTIRHGTRSSYVNHRCRCDACTLAQRHYSKTYYSSTKETRLDWQRQYYANNRESRDSYNTQYRRSNNAYINEKARYRWHANPERSKAWSRAKNQRRRALLAQADVRTVSERDWHRLCERYRWSCAMCGERRKLTVEHIIPLSRGGRHSIGNLLPLCSSCNSSKLNNLLIEWRKRDNRTWPGY